MDSFTTRTAKLFFKSHDSHLNCYVSKYPKNKKIQNKLYAFLCVNKLNKLIF